MRSPRADRLGRYEVRAGDGRNGRGTRTRSGTGGWGMARTRGGAVGFQSVRSDAGPGRLGASLRLASALVSCLALANCGGYDRTAVRPRKDSRLGVAASPRVVAPGQPVPKGGGVYMVGKPYRVADRWYVPRDVDRYRAVGLASWYGSAFHGRLTANREIYDSDSLSAAHPTLPIPSYVRVTNLENGRSVVVRVNDRGPYHADRLLDVSKRTAEVLGFWRRGTARVHVAYIGLAPLEGSDDRKLLATLQVNGRPAYVADTMIASAPPPRPAPRRDAPYAVASLEPRALPHAAPPAPEWQASPASTLRGPAHAAGEPTEAPRPERRPPSAIEPARSAPAARAPVVAAAAPAATSWATWTPPTIPAAQAGE